MPRLRFSWDLDEKEHDLEHRLATTHVLDAQALEKKALCDELILGVRLLAATRASFAVPAVPPVPVKSSISVPGRTAVFSALVALCLMLMAVVSEVRRGYSPSVLLQDAVALSDLLDGSEMIPVDREADVEGLIDDHVAMPENPDWLITALDLDEQDSDVDVAPEEDEGLF